MTMRVVGVVEIARFVLVKELGYCTADAELDLLRTSTAESRLDLSPHTD
jgi:hypothetical protein